MGMEYKEEVAWKSFFRKCTDKEELERQEELLNTFSDSVYSYIKGGNPTPTLIEFANEEADLTMEYRNYENDFPFRTSEFMAEVNGYIVKTGEKSKLHIEDRNNNEQDQEYDGDLYLTVFQKFKEAYEAAIRRTDMYARVNELYRLYHKEEDERHTMDVFRCDCDNHGSLLTIVKLLSDKNGMFAKDIEMQGIEKSELEDVINSCKKYFNVRSHKGNTYISLNFRGRMLSEIAFQEIKNSDKIYYNINNVLAAIEKNQQLELVGMRPSHEKVVRKKFYEVKRISQTKLSNFEYCRSENVSIIIDNEEDGVLINGRKKFRI